MEDIVLEKEIKREGCHYYLRRKSRGKDAIRIL